MITTRLPCSTAGGGGRRRGHVGDSQGKAKGGRHKAPLCRVVEPLQAVRMHSEGRGVPRWLTLVKGDARERARVRACCKHAAEIRGERFRQGLQSFAAPRLPPAFTSVDGCDGQPPVSQPCDDSMNRTGQQQPAHLCHALVGEILHIHHPGSGGVGRGGGRRQRLRPVGADGLVDGKGGEWGRWWWRGVGLGGGARAAPMCARRWRACAATALPQNFRSPASAAAACCLLPALEGAPRRLGHAPCQPAAMPVMPAGPSQRPPC